MEKTLKNLLQKNNVILKKAYGQNFLTDEKLLLDIVEKAGVGKDDTVLEIGCGAGALTNALSKRAKRVVGYEIDTSLKPVLEQTLDGAENVEIIYKDIMKEKIKDVEKKLKGEYIMVANLPYYITTPIVTEFLENAENLKAMVIMVQKEVAERFCAQPSSSDYGAITVAINLRGDANIIMQVGREMFTPVPNVDSAVVKINIDRKKSEGVDLIKVRNIVRCAFSSRRKMLVNNVMKTYKLNRDDAERVLTKANIPLTARGEVLSYIDYVRLAEILG